MNIFNKSIKILDNKKLKFDFNQIKILNIFINR